MDTITITAMVKNRVKNFLAEKGGVAATIFLISVTVLLGIIVVAAIKDFGFLGGVTVLSVLASIISGAVWISQS